MQGCMIIVNESNKSLKNQATLYEAESMIAFHTVNYMTLWMKIYVGYFACLKSWKLTNSSFLRVAIS